MQRPSFFLRTKLMPPRAVSDLLPRPRLTSALEKNLQSPMTLIAADAGCGKTTLIADFVRTQSRPCVWYQLDHTDAEPSAFLGYVTHGIRNVVPDFGDAIFEYLAEANEELLRLPERAADLLINEILESVEQPLIIVLDDYHHIGRDTVVHRIVDRLLQYSSDLVHLVLTTRDLPPLAMMRRRAQSSVLVLTRDDLLFTDDEVKGLFRNTLGTDLEPGEVAQYRDRTHGWVTALQLVRQVAEQELHSDSDRSVDLLEMLKRSEKDIFDYFAEEVFSREPGAVRQLLMSVSLLESIPLETCSLLFPDLRCSAMLPELVQKNVFMTVTGDGSGEEYRLHPLFREFLLRRLRSETGRAGLAEERSRIAHVFLDQGSWQKALPFLIEAENYDEAARLIAEHGGDLIGAGAFVTLDAFAARIPTNFLRAHPQSLLHAAEVSRIQGNVDRATELLNDAIALFESSGDLASEAEALQALASIERRRGSIGKAILYLDRAETLAHAGSATLLKCANTRGLCLIAEGKWSEAEQQFRFALELAEQQGNRHYQRLVMHNLALPSGFRGDFGEALRWFRRIFREDGESRQLPQEAIGHLNVARLHLYRGEFEETARHLGRSLELCQLFNMRALRPEIFEAYANYYRDLDDFVHAEEFYERAAKAYDEVEIDISTKEFNEERAKFFIRRNDLRKARALLAGLIEARSQHGSMAIHTAQLGLAQIDLLENKIDGLAERVVELHKHFHESNHHYDEALAELLLAEVMLKKGNEGGAADHVNRVLDLSARYDYDFWLRREMRRVPALFAIEDIADRLPSDLRAELSRPPGSAEAAVNASVTSAPTVTDLTINVLGPVDIYRDPSLPFAKDAWTTRRSRDIFCFVATSKHRRVAKDVLIDTFWRDEDPKVVEKNFHPTISHIRKALNSQQTLKQNFLVFRDGAYQLNPELAYVIDAEEFDRSVFEAETAKREKDNDRLRAALESAHRLYRGDFMPGVYEDWADERRAYYAEQFARVTGALAKLSLTERRYADANRFASEVLKLDPYREDMHRLILKVHAAQGKPAAARKHFESMSKLFREELGIEPSPETIRLAEELLER